MKIEDRIRTEYPSDNIAYPRYYDEVTDYRFRTNDVTYYNRGSIIELLENEIGAKTRISMSTQWLYAGEPEYKHPLPIFHYRFTPTVDHDELGKVYYDKKTNKLILEEDAFAIFCDGRCKSKPLKVILDE